MESTCLYGRAAEQHAHQVNHTKTGDSVAAGGI